MSTNERNKRKFYLEIRLYAVFGTLAVLAFMIAGWLGAPFSIQALAALATFFGGIALFVVVTVAYSAVVGMALMKGVEIASRHESTIWKVFDRIIDVPARMLDKWVATPSTPPEPKAAEPRDKTPPN